jgi:DNA-binding CsgD family transcriptional regulator
MEYIDFNMNKQKEFMRLVKFKSNYTWKEIARYLKINRSMVYFYLGGHSKISLKNYNMLCALAKIKRNGRSIVEINNKTKPIKILKSINNELSELLGILSGDGHISKTNYEVSVSGNLREGKDYMTKHVKGLFEKLFWCHVRIYEYRPNNNIKCIVNSKMLVEFLNKIYGLPIGKKKNRLHIPTQIMHNKSHIKNYLRGLFDTDGSVYKRRKKDLVISIIARDKVFLEEVKNGLITLGYTPSISGKNLYI